MEVTNPVAYRHAAVVPMKKRARPRATYVPMALPRVQNSARTIGSRPWSTGEAAVVVDNDAQRVEQRQGHRHDLAAVDDGTPQPLPVPHPGERRAVEVGAEEIGAVQVRAREVAVVDAQVAEAYVLPL